MSSRLIVRAKSCGSVTFLFCRFANDFAQRVLTAAARGRRAYKRGPTSTEATMNLDRIAGNWKQVKGKVKEQWGKLTDDDLDQIAGKRDQLEGKIQERYGLAKDRVSRDLDD